MPWVFRDVVNDINQAVGRRWQGLDPLLPAPNDLPEGCMAPLLARGENDRPAGLGVCHHQHVPADTLAQTWGAATKFALTMRLREADTGPAADDLLTQWHAHLRAQPEAGADDTAAIVNWPARDITGVLALLRHGLAPLSVIAAAPPAHGERPGRPASASPARRGGSADLVIRSRRPGRPGHGDRVRDGRDPVRRALRRVGPAPGHRGAGPRRIAGRPGRDNPAGAGWPSKTAGPSPWSRSSRRSAAGWIAGMTRPGRDGLPADHVRAARRAQRRDRRGPGPARAPRARRPRDRRDSAALTRSMNPAVGAVLAPDGIPAAVVHVGGPAGRHPALNRDQRSRAGDTST